MLTVLDIVLRTAAWLKERGCASPRLDAELLIGHVLGLERVELYMQFERPMTEAELEAIRPLVARRGKREPVATIIGHKGFWTLDLVVTPGVLVPRPDTETLVSAALAMVPDEGETFVADVGCGSGAIGLAIASEKPGVKLYATDVSEAAVACTRTNVAALGLGERVAVLRGPGLRPIPPHRPIDIVVSNPPYIPSAEIETLAPEVRDHEPREALDGGPDGLDAYRALVPELARRARIAVLVEVGAGQADAVAAMFRAAGLVGVGTHRDLGNIERVVEGRAASATVAPG